MFWVCVGIPFFFIMLWFFNCLNDINDRELVKKEEEQVEEKK